jgi:ATP-dependent RNA helicase RhlE
LICCTNGRQWKVINTLSKPLTENNLPIEEASASPAVGTVLPLIATAPADVAVQAAPSATFDMFGLAEPIIRAVHELGYRIPTPIQEQAIPVVLQGKDVMGAAQTGTGKTAGFALPILQKLMPHANFSASPARHPVRALILAPTRELADQIYANVRDYAKHTGLKSTVVFGGVDIVPQIAALRMGCEVLIATPGRLLDHMGQRTVSLGQTEILVLDEADRMLDMGFLPDIQRILNALPSSRQNLMFSATFSNEIRKLAETFLNSPILIEVARRNATADNVEQAVYRVADGEAKRAAVTQLIRDRKLGSALVFTNTKIGAGRLARQLERDGLNAGAIHGDKTQQERLATLEAFKKGEILVLVATDVAARGLDIVELPAVINYDLPYSPEDYVHRIGRTGRAGASGVALSLMTREDERLLADIERMLKRKLPVLDLNVEDPGRLARVVRAEKRAGEAPTHKAHRPRDKFAPGAPVAIPGYSNDPFFFKPYEPSVAVANPTAGNALAGGNGNTPISRSLTGGRKSAAPIAALLGGGKRKT